MDGPFQGACCCFLRLSQSILRSQTLPHGLDTRAESRTSSRSCYRNRPPRLGYSPNPRWPNGREGMQPWLGRRATAWANLPLAQAIIGPLEDQLAIHTTGQSSFFHLQGRALQRKPPATARDIVAHLASEEVVGAFSNVDECSGPAVSASRTETSYCIRGSARSSL